MPWSKNIGKVSDVCELSRTPSRFRIHVSWAPAQCQVPTLREFPRCVIPKGTQHVFTRAIWQIKWGLFSLKVLEDNHPGRSSGDINFKRFYFLTAFLALDKNRSSKELESRGVKKPRDAEGKQRSVFHTIYINWPLPYQFKCLVIFVNTSDTYRVQQHKGIADDKNHAFIHSTDFFRATTC